MAKTRSQKRQQREARRQFTKRAQEARWQQQQDAPRMEPQEDARIVVLEARARQMGCKMHDDLKLAVFGDQAGRALVIGTRDKTEAERLHKLYAAIDLADETYHRRILGKDRFAKTMKLELLPEPMEASADDRIDIRSDAERDRAAVSEWMRWHGLIGHLAAHERTAIWDGVKQRADLIRDGRMTLAGEAFVRALRLLHAIMETRGLTVPVKCA